MDPIMIPGKKHKGNLVDVKHMEVLETFKESLEETPEDGRDGSLSHDAPVDDTSLLCEASTERIFKRLKLSDSPPLSSSAPTSTMPIPCVKHTKSFYLNRRPNRHRKPRSVSFTFSKIDERGTQTPMLESRRSSINSGIANGMTPLMFAARDGEVLRTATLLQGGEDPSVIDKRGFDALMYAVRDGNEAIAKILLESQRVNVNIRTKHGLTHTLYAAINGHANCIRALMSFLSDDEKKKLVNIPDDSGFTPLMGAAQNGHLETVELLLDCGASIEQKDRHGMTALFWAVTANVLDVVSLLIQRGADVNTCERKDKSPLLYSVVKGQTAMAKLLLSNKAKVCERVRIYCLMDHVKQTNLKKKWEQEKLRGHQHQ